MKYPVYILLILTLIIGINCGKDEEEGLYLSGTLEVDTGKDIITGPAFVAIATTDDFDLLRENMTDYLVELVTVDLTDYSFIIDLTDTKLRPGDSISILGFIDNDYANSIPNLTVGDYMGFYFNKDEMQMTYELQPGLNSNIAVKINRRVYDYEADINGTISGQAVVGEESVNYQGNVMLVAYTGEIGLGFDNYNVEDILGFEEITLSGTPEPYTIDLLPYGRNIPIEDVYVIAIFDTNGNKKPDEGEYVGFYTVEENQFPTLLTIDIDSTCDININPIMQVSIPSGHTITFSGTIDKPDIFYQSEDPAAENVFLLIATVDGDNPADFMDQIMDEPFGRMKYFAEVPWDEEDFNIDLSKTNLEPGDRVLVAAIWDRNTDSSFPNPEPEDYIGFYINEENGETTYTIREGDNAGILINLNREIFDYDIEIGVKLQNGDTSNCKCDNNNVMVVAYTGEISSFNFDDEFDINGVVGYTSVFKNSNPFPATGDLSLPIFPYGHNIPIINVYLIAMCDKNNNKIPDTGDVIGFYVDPLIVDSKGLPTLLNITKYPLNNMLIKFSMVLQPSSGYNVPLKCKIDMPPGKPYTRYSKPVYIMIAESNTSNPADILNNSIESIRYFKKIPAPLTPPGGVSTIDLTVDLSDTTLAAGDNIVITAIWDLDYKGGFPYPTLNDYIGFYINLDNYSAVYTLKSPTNSEIRFSLDRIVYEYEASISGTVIEGGSGFPACSGDLTIVAYKGDLSSFDFSQTMDIDNVAGFTEITKRDNQTDAFTLDIMPFGTSLPDDMYLFAFLDKNNNGKPDAGDIIGFLDTARNGTGLPLKFTMNEGTLSQIDNKNIIIYLIMEIPAAGNYKIPLNCKINLPSPHNTGTGDIYFAMVKSDNIGDLINGDIRIDKVSYFQILSPNNSTTHTFTVNLQNYPLTAGDEVAIFALWDKDNSGPSAPTLNDKIGFYIDEENMTFIYTLKSVKNDDIVFPVDRTVYNYKASISGTVSVKSQDAYLSGDITIIAYAGVLDSLDMDQIDYDNVIGFASVAKASGQTSKSYTINIMPYGRTVPINDVYIIGYLDCNKNGKPDGGDRMGTYMQPPSSFGMSVPATVNIPPYANLDKNIELSMVLSNPSNSGISISGSFQSPPGYTSNPATKPISIIVASTTGGSMEEFFDDPMNALKAMVKLPQGSNSFNIDLSNTSLVAGNKIIIIAVWDKNWVKGFVNPDAGDLIGVWMDMENMSFTIPLASGANTVPGGSGYEFRLDKRMYSHNCSVRYRLDNDYIGKPSGSYYDPGDNVIVTVIHKDGVNTSTREMNPRYVLAMSAAQIPETITDSTATSTFENTWYNIKLLPMIYDPSIYDGGAPLVTGTFRIESVYLMGILDNAPANGGPDEGECMGYFYYYSWFLGSMPQEFIVDNYENTPENMTANGLRIFTESMYRY